MFFLIYQKLKDPKNVHTTKSYSHILDKVNQRLYRIPVCREVS